MSYNNKFIILDLILVNLVKLIISHCISLIKYITSKLNKDVNYIIILPLINLVFVLIMIFTFTNN